MAPTDRGWSACDFPKPTSQAWILIYRNFTPPMFSWSPSTSGSCSRDKKSLWPNCLHGKWTGCPRKWDTLSCIAFPKKYWRLSHLVSWLAWYRLVRHSSSIQPRHTAYNYMKPLGRYLHYRGAFSHIYQLSQIQHRSPSLLYRSANLLDKITFWDFLCFTVKFILSFSENPPPPPQIFMIHIRFSEAIFTQRKIFNFLDSERNKKTKEDNYLDELSVEEYKYGGDMIPKVGKTSNKSRSFQAK